MTCLLLYRFKTALTNVNMLYQTYRPSTSNIFWNFPVLVLLFLLPIDSTSKLFWTFSFLYSQESYLIHYIHTYINLYYIFYLCLFMFLYGRRKWQLTPVFLLRESHGQRSLAGYMRSGLSRSPWHSCPPGTFTCDLIWNRVSAGLMGQAEQAWTR